MPGFTLPGGGYAVWMTAFALSLIGVLAGLLGLFFPALTRRPLVSRCWSFLLSLLGVFLLIQLLALVQNGLEGTEQFLAKVAILLAGLLLLRAFVAGLGTTAPARGLPLRSTLALLVASLGLTIWLACALENDLPHADLDALTPPPMNLVEIPNSLARTDKGTPIPLLVNEDQQRLTAAQEMSLLKNLGITLGLIRKAPPDPVSNCHGWVFAGGLYHLGGRWVPPILEENAYQQIENPEVGDLVVYRNDVGEVLHTGVVRALGYSGLVLIESKWSLWGRYLHEAATQCYSSHYTFYHSPRQGHMLAGLSAEVVGGSRGTFNE